MCCLKEQSRRHFRTIVWRFRMLFKRDKQSLYYALFYPMIFIGMAIGIGMQQLSGEKNQLNAIQDTVVTSSEFIGSDNIWLDEATGFSTTQDFEKCRVNKAESIGLIKDEAHGDAANDALEKIFNEINAAFTLIVPTGLAKVTFANQGEANDYIQADSYASNKLCFTLAWSRFDNDLSEPDFALQIGTDLEQSRMPDTNIPQDRFYEEKYSNASLTSFNETNFLQVMTLATRVVLEESKRIPSGTLQDKFSVMYTPISTGEFENNKDGVSMLLSMVYESVGLVISIVMKSVQEPQEDMIELIMKRLGVQKSVIITRDLVVTSVLSLIWTVIIVFVIWGAFFIDELGLGVLFVFSLINQVQVILRQQIIGNLMPQWAANLFMFVYFLIQISLSFVLVTAVPDTNLTILGCVISPMIQLNQVFHMTFMQLMFKNKLDFSNFGLEVFPGISLSLIFSIALPMAFFYALVLVYMWPYKIETDPENPLSWYYPFTCSFWCKKQCMKVNPADESQVEDHFSPHVVMQTDMTDLEIQNTSAHAQIGAEEQQDVTRLPLQQAEKDLIKRGHLEVPALSSNEKNGRLVISELTKLYGRKKVVDDLNLTIYQNEILVLLGHNGAGKTTTLNMLTGLTKPNSGQAVVHNIQDGIAQVDLFKDYQNIADFIGLCPQVDVLFTKMTVRENLLFYCKLKNVPDMDTVIDETLEKFNLTSRQSAFATEISGGQKRKLQLAIALLGNSKLVLLDEPTSGMDPTARRETWEIIKAAKKDKIIILTTHYMDEAEYLADRVAVVSRGALKICGTTSFLKEKFGQYFYLEVEPAHIRLANDSDSELMRLLKSHNQKYQHSQAQANRGNGGQYLENHLIQQEEDVPDTDRAGAVGIDGKSQNHQYVPITKTVDEAGKVVYKLAHYMAKEFRPLFEQIDANLQAYGIKDYRIKNMTLEQVFIAIGEQEIKQDQTAQERNAEKEKSQLIDALPPKQPGGVGYAMIIATFQGYWQKGAHVISILIFLTMLITFTAIFAPQMATTWDTLTYTDYSGIFEADSAELHSLKYNAFYADGTTPNGLAEKVVEAYASDLSGEPQDAWQRKTDQTYTDFLTEVSTGLESGDRGAYWIDVRQNLGSVDIDAVIYADASSPASTPVYGNMLLQAIARQIISNDKFKLSFEYKPFEQTVSLLEEKHPQIRQPTCSFGGMLAVFLEMYLFITFISQLYNGFFSTILMRGATIGSIVLPRIVTDFIMNFLFFESLWISNVIFGLRTDGWQQIGLLWCAAQALYQAAFNALSCYKQVAIVFRFIFMFASMMLCNFVGSFTQNYVERPDGQDTARLICWIACFSPTVQLLYGIFFIQYRYVVYVLQNSGLDSGSDAIDSDYEVEPFSEYGAQNQFYILLGQIGAYFLLTMVFLAFCKNSPPKGSDGEIAPEHDTVEVPVEVTNEAGRIAGLVNQQGEKGDLLIVQNLVKRYYTSASAKSEKNNEQEHRPAEENEDLDDKKASKEKKGFNAVKGTSFGVKRGEVFSLLGVNGAGKSSTFDCLVGYSRVSGGKVVIDGQDVGNFVGRPQLLHGLIGYCPQTNTFDPSMTVEQLVTLICRLTGIPDNTLYAYVNSTIIRFGLAEFRKTRAGSLSGGNQRKLSLCMAMIGRPKIIYIDEASAGVDPGSRRTMWKAIRHEGADSAVVLTTHAMEEAEAISTKIAIQVHGWFRSFGTLAQVLGEGQSGYFVDLSIDLDTMAAAILEDHVQLKATTVTKDINIVLGELQKWEQKLHKENLSEEFVPNGLLDSQYQRVQKGESIDLRNVLRELLMQDAIATIIEEFEDAGMAAHVQKHDGSYINLKVTSKRQMQMSFGQIYAFVEGLKQKNSMIKDYSCKLSSLEEVFNAHAAQATYAKLNTRLERRRTMTFRK